MKLEAMFKARMDAVGRPEASARLKLAIMAKLLAMKLIANEDSFNS